VKVDVFIYAMRSSMGRNQKIKYVLMFLSFMLVTCYVVSVATGSTQVKEHGETKTGKIVARVNGSPIYEAQIKPEVDKGLQKFRKYGMRKESPATIKRLQMKALTKVIDQKLIDQESRKQTIENLDEKVEQRVQALKKKYGSQKLYDRILKQKRQTEESLRESLKNRIYIDEYLKKKGVLEPQIPEYRIRKFYEKNALSYYREETVNVSHILIVVDENGTPEEKEKARQRAEQIRKEIMAGEDFAEMARKHSACSSAQKGGKLGYVKRGYMPEEFDKVAFATADGDVAGEIVETQFGYHIIKVSDKVPAGITPYEEIRDFLKKYLQEEESKKKLAALLVELKKKAKIDILLD
jgi:peptidyl-prolyl cis-trans isomerase C